MAAVSLLAHGREKALTTAHAQCAEAIKHGDVMEAIR